MNKVVILKKLSVLACVLTLPLWLGCYCVTVFGDMYLPVSTPVPILCALFGPPLILLLLILGGISKRPRVAGTLCGIGVTLFLATVISLGVASYATNNCHVQPYKDLQAADLSSVELWLGEDEQGADIWQPLEPADAEVLVEALHRLDYYKEWHDGAEGEMYQDIPIDNPEWHFRLVYPSGYEERISVGHVYTYTHPDEGQVVSFWGSYYLISFNGAAPALYQSRPYDMWDGDCWNRELYDLYRELLPKYEL